MRSPMLAGLAVILFLPGLAHGAKVWDPSPYSQEVTECDRLASHGEDPFRVAPGVSRANMDFPRAIAACEAAVAAEPANPRLRYQLGRVLWLQRAGRKSPSSIARHRYRSRLSPGAVRQRISTPSGPEQGAQGRVPSRRADA